VVRSLDVHPLHMNVALASYLLSPSAFVSASGPVAGRFSVRNVFGTAINTRSAFTRGSIFAVSHESF